MRYIYQGHYKDGYGNVIPSGTVTVYTAGFAALATCYANSTTATAITGSQITTDSAGKFTFYIDSEDYRYTQKFAIRLSKTNYQTKDYDDLVILPVLSGVRYPYTDLLGFTTIQEGIDSANNGGTGRKYLLPPQGDYSGVHTLTSPLAINSKGNFAIEGVRGRDSNWTGSTLKASGALASILDFSLSDFFDIRKLRLDGNSTAVNGINLGLATLHASHLVLDDITIQNVTGTAIDTDAGNGGPAADCTWLRPLIEMAAIGIDIGGQGIRILGGTIAGCSDAALNFTAASTAVMYGVTMTGNNIDIKYMGNDTIGEMLFSGCWFENADVAILKRPNVPSITKACSSIVFLGCHFHADVGATLLDFTNIEGTHYIIGGKWASDGTGSVIVPVNCTLYIDAPFADQLSYSGAGTVIFGPSCNRVYARAYRGTSNQSVNAGAWTKVQLNAESWDYKSKFDSATNYRYQPGVAGVYGVKAMIQFASTEIDKQYYIALYVDGALARARRFISPLTGSTLDVDIADDVVLGATSYLELYCYHDSAAAKDLVFDANGSTTYMSVHKIG